MAKSKTFQKCTFWTCFEWCSRETRLESRFGIKCKCEDSDVRIVPQIANDYDFYITEHDIEFWNIVSIFFIVEELMHFVYEANIDLLSRPSPQNLETFFKNSGSPFIFTPKSVSLDFGDGVIEDFLHEAETNPSVEIDKRIAIGKHNLVALNFRSGIDKDIIIDAYCHLIDNLIERNKESDLKSAESFIEECVEKVCRKDHHEMVIPPGIILVQASNEENEDLRIERYDGGGQQNFQEHHGDYGNAQRNLQHQQRNCFR